MKFTGSNDDLALLKEGDIITIPKDQYGKPVLRIDPVTRKATKELRTFRVTSVEHDVVGNIILANIEPAK
jgi:hypothetical protein